MGTTTSSEDDNDDDDDNETDVDVDAVEGECVIQCLERDGEGRGRLPVCARQLAPVVMRLEAALSTDFSLVGRLFIFLCVCYHHSQDFKKRL